MALLSRVQKDFVMQGVYLRLNHSVPWTLVRRTRSVADAEALCRRVARDKRRGRLLYLEASGLPDSIWDLRTLDHRKLGGWLCKALLPGYRVIVRGGRKAWQKSPAGQLSLFG